VGILVSEVVDRYKECITEKAATLTFVLGFILLLLDFKVGPSGGKFDWFNSLGLVPKNAAEYTIGLAMACGLLLVGTLRSKRVSELMSIKPLRMLGAVSYSLFLIHPFFILAVFPKLMFSSVPQLQPLIDPVVAAPAWYVPVVMFPGALTWATVCFVLIERPFLRLRPN
jgi:peptidoglycan/LPS O-acetylase OafA/YrhL